MLIDLINSKFIIYIYKFKVKYILLFYKHLHTRSEKGIEFL